MGSAKCMESCLHVGVCVRVFVCIIQERLLLLCNSAHQVYYYSTCIRNSSYFLELHLSKKLLIIILLLRVRNKY